MSRFCCPLVAVAFALAMLMLPTTVQAVVLIDDDFTAAEGYADGKLQFQQPNGDGNGIWLGQFNDPDDPNNGGTGNPSVDTSGTGTVNVITGSPGATPVATGDAFLRNVWNLGATGVGLAGQNETNEVGGGFNLGDRILIDVQFQFTLPDGVNNHAMFISGVTDCFAQCGFNAAPRAGIETGVSEFQAGSLKVFTHFGRSFTTGGDNAFGLIIPLPELGVANGWNPDTMAKDLPTDLDSDMIAISYTAELTDDVNKVWKATELVVTNVTTATEVSRASVDKPDALEEFVWDSLANAPNDDPTTPTEEGQAAHPTDPGSEMYFGTRWIDNTTVGGSASFDSVRFEYIPNIPFVAGDYSGNGTVDLADYTIWRDTIGSVGGGLAADGTGDDDLGVPDGDVDEFDYAFWKNRFGDTFGAGSLESATVPEPASCVLLIAGALGLACLKAARK